jgi:hypothetical protein
VAKSDGSGPVTREVKYNEEGGEVRWPQPMCAVPASNGSIAASSEQLHGAHLGSMPMHSTNKWQANQLAGVLDVRCG